jgi:hypothetical protein
MTTITATLAVAATAGANLCVSVSDAKPHLRLVPDDPVGRILFGPRPYVSGLPTAFLEGRWP